MPARAEPRNDHSLAPAAPALMPVSATSVHVRPASLPPAAPARNLASVPCSAPRQFVHLEHPLLHTAQRLAAGRTLTIVAIGSSSTAGAGASSPAASYPSRLAIELRKLLPGHDIVVLNRGVNGEETNDMMARFATGVIAEHPQLVLWQVGTNSLLRDHPLAPHAIELREGIARLKATGADLVLIDPQYAPRVLAKAETPDMVSQIAALAQEENVDLFRRFAVMRAWNQEQHRSFDVFVSPDKLHMNDWGYACWANLLAGAIVDAASNPVAAAVP
jgi:lysophospholipase L1-like esterase